MRDLQTDRSTIPHILGRFESFLRTAWGRGGRISANVSRDLSRGRLVNDGWPLPR